MRLARNAREGQPLPGGSILREVWMDGHDGQSIAIVPSRELAVLRLELTPTKLKHRPRRWCMPWCERCP
jgi:hypothetical protein